MAMISEKNDSSSSATSVDRGRCFVHVIAHNCHLGAGRNGHNPPSSSSKKRDAGSDNSSSGSDDDDDGHSSESSSDKGIVDKVYERRVLSFIHIILGTTTEKTTKIKFEKDIE